MKWEEFLFSFRFFWCFFGCCPALSCQCHFYRRSHTDSGNLHVRACVCVCETRMTASVPNTIQTHWQVEKNAVYKTWQEFRLISARNADTRCVVVSIVRRVRERFSVWREDSFRAGRLNDWKLSIRTRAIATKQHMKRLVTVNNWILMSLGFRAQPGVLWKSRWPSWAPRPGHKC